MNTYNVLTNDEFFEKYKSSLKLDPKTCKFTTKAFSTIDDTVAIYQSEIDLDMFFQLPNYQTKRVPESRRYIYYLPKGKYKDLYEDLSNEPGHTRYKIPYSKLIIVADPYLDTIPADLNFGVKIREVENFPLTDEELINASIKLDLDAAINNKDLAEVIITSTSAVKNDKNKVMMELLPPVALEKIAKVFTFGAKKYSSWNWSKGMQYSRLYGALQRHLSAWYRGEDLDFDPNCEDCKSGNCKDHSGESHLANAGCCLTMLIEMQQFRPDMDDRPNHYSKK